MRLCYSFPVPVLLVGVLGHGGVYNYTIGDVSYAGLGSKLSIFSSASEYLSNRSQDHIPGFSKTSSQRASSAAGGGTRFSP